MHKLGRKTHLLLVIFLFFGFNQSIKSDHHGLGEFEDHKYDTPKTTQGAIRAPQSASISVEVIYGSPK